MCIIICFVWVFIVIQEYREKASGLRVTWDGRYNWDVYIPAAYKDKICGLCGKWDGNKNNDLTLRGGSQVSH